MRERRFLTIVWLHDYLVLRFHDNGVASSEEKHRQHDAVKFAIANAVSSISFFTHTLCLVLKVNKIKLINK